MWSTKLGSLRAFATFGVMKFVCLEDMRCQGRVNIIFPVRATNLADQIECQIEICFNLRTKLFCLREREEKVSAQLTRAVDGRAGLGKISGLGALPEPRQNP